MIVLIPLFMGILQLGVFLHVRNTLTMCAHEGARVGANWNRTAAQGGTSARSCIADALGSGWSSNVSAAEDGNRVVVTVTGRMPAFGVWGPTFDFQVTGRAVKEPPVA